MIKKWKIMDKNTILPAKIIISDVSGKVISEESIQAKENEKIINTKSFINGMYTYEVIGPKGLIQGGKINIIHQ